MLGIFLFVFRFNESLQIGKTGLPEDTILFEPFVDCLQWFRVELVETVTAFASFFHEVGASQQTQMFRDGGP